VDLEIARNRLVEHLGCEIGDKRVLEVMSHIRRELFIPAESCHSAYEDIPLSIGFGQTISQPFIIALMTQALELRGDEKVLEVGTGSGYQAAILAELVRWVVSVERIPRLAESAKYVLDNLGYTNVEIHNADVALGWVDGAPYDAIIVTAAAPFVSNVLIDQLAMGGRMVIPVGSRWEQELRRITRRKQQNLVENLGGCHFVPLIGEDAWEA